MAGVLAPYVDRSHRRVAVASPSSRYRRIADRIAATEPRARIRRGSRHRIHRLTGRTSHGIDTTSRTRRRRRARRHAAACRNAPAKAAAPVADKQAPSFYRYKVGDAQVTVISDGVNNFALARYLRAQRQEGRSQRGARKGLHAEGQDVSIQFAPLVINTGGKLVVVDTGNGPAAFASSKGNVGQFASQHGRRRLRSQGRRHGGDLAFPRRPHQRPADRRRTRRRSPTPRCWCRRPSGNTSWTTAR